MDGKVFLSLFFCKNYIFNTGGTRMLDLNFVREKPEIVKQIIRINSDKKLGLVDEVSLWILS
jgi:hypothetical protein